MANILPNSLLGIAQKFRLDFNGLLSGDTERPSLLDLQDKIRVYRLEIIQLFASNNKHISPEWLQKTTITYDKTIQPTSGQYLKFALPSPIVELPNGLGLGYIGTSDGKTLFSYAKSDVALTNAINSPFTAPTINSPTIKTDRQFIYVYGNMSLKAITINYIGENPMLFSGFSNKTDIYPISGWFVSSMFDMIVREVTIGLKQPIDKQLDNKVS
jgi:hypothetical protein